MEPRPQDLPGFRDVTLAYYDAMDTLTQALLPLYARALDLPADYFSVRCDAPLTGLRLTHYPPVAAYDVPSPIDVVESGVTGELAGDLSIAVACALKLDRDGVRRGAAKFTWERVAEMFEEWLVPLDAAQPAPAAGLNDPGVVELTERTDLGQISL